MATTPFTIVGRIYAPEPSSLDNTTVFLKNMYGEELEVQYDNGWLSNGIFTVNAGNFDHNPIYEEFMTITAVDPVASYRRVYNFQVAMTSPQFLPQIDLEPYDVTAPIINAIYFLEGEYTNQQNNHLIMDVDGAASMEFYGDVTVPTIGERILFNDQIVTRLTTHDGLKTVRIKFYDENNNSSEGSASITYDTIKPFVVSITATGSTSVVLTFNEVIRNDDANNASYYRIAGLHVRSAELLPDRYTVRLTTSSMFAIRYTMEVRSIRDLAGNVMDDLIVSFEGYDQGGFDWTDEIIADDTLIRQIHIDELRANSLIKGVTPPQGGWTDPLIVADTTDILFEHWIELRERISRTYANRFGESVSWTSGPLVKDKSYLSARHIKELRAVVDAL